MEREEVLTELLFRIYSDTGKLASTVPNLYFPITNVEEVYRKIDKLSEKISSEIEDYQKVKAGAKIITLREVM